MGLNFKRFFSPKKEESNPSPVASNAATPITSPAGSIHNVDIANKYLNDPIRNTKKPDTVGNFVDPMMVNGGYTVGRDVTNTGA